MTLPNLLYLDGVKYQRQIDGIPLPAGDFRRILHDDEANDGKQRIGMPETQPLYYVDFSPLTELWQHFWVAQMVHSFTGYRHWDFWRLTISEQELIQREWRSLTHGAKAFTNNHGTEQYRDYISGANVGAELPKQAALDCCGNVVRVVGEPTKRGVPIETLDGMRPPPPMEKVNRLTTPWLIFCATNVPADKSDPRNWKPIILPDGRYRVDPFPNLAPKDTPVPLRSNSNKTISHYVRDGIDLSMNWIQPGRLVPVTDRVVPRPYVP